jgi:precorrin-2/cobalt-factor-2 C20-methyltransferase
MGGAQGSRVMKGTLYGIGLGPGDPELITLKALRILRGVKVVAYPAPDSGPSLARQIAAPYIADGQTELEFSVPMRGDRTPAQGAYDEAVKLIAAHLDTGADVAVLCEGDPFFYSSFMYVFERLSGRYRAEIVPGVSSVMASAAALGRPLAARNDRFTVIPAPLDDAAIEAALKGSEAAAIIKIGRHFNRIYDILKKLNLLGAAGYVERATFGEQAVKQLADMLPHHNAPYFSMILIYVGREGWSLRAAGTVLQ